MRKLLEAIDKSIEKWKGIVHHGDMDGGIDDCACCQLVKEPHINGGYTTNCMKCPVLLYAGMRDNTVYTRSGSTGCGLTPWIDAPDCVYDKEDQDSCNKELTFLYEVRRACLVTGGTFNVPA